MQFVTYCNIWLKCYLKLFNYFMIVADGKRSSNVLVNTIGNFYKLIFEKNIKELKNFYSFFKVTIISLFWDWTSQDNLSVFCNSSIPTISEGMVVLNDLDRGFCCITLDLTSNNFIPPYILFFINIFDNILYIIYLYFLEI